MSYPNKTDNFIDSINRDSINVNNHDMCIRFNLNHIVALLQTGHGDSAVFDVITTSGDKFMVSYKDAIPIAKFLAKQEETLCT